MSNSATVGPVLVEGFYGLPLTVRELHGPEPGTVEWLLSAVEHHASAEAGALLDYERLGESSGDPVVALVMQLILEDEQRHHGLLKRIEASLRDALTWSHSPTALPTSPALQPPLHADLAALARVLVAEERAGAHKMRELAEHEKGIDGGFHSLLLEMMAMDSDKHACLLRFVQDRLQARAQVMHGPAD